MRYLVRRAAISLIPAVPNSITCSLNFDDGCAAVVSEAVFTAGHWAEGREPGQDGEAGERQPV